MKALIALITLSLIVSLSILVLPIKAQQPTLPPELRDLDAEQWNELLKKGQATPPSQLTAQDKELQDKVLNFLATVAKIDTASYTIETFVDNVPGPNYDKTLKLKLSSDDSKIDVLCLFRDNSLFWCTIHPVQGSPASTRSESSDALTIAKDTLESLQTFSAKDHFPKMLIMLNDVTELKSSKSVNAEFTQEIAISDNTARISWEPYANGLSNPQNKLTLEFKDGNLLFFADFLGLFTIGSSDVIITEKDAIQIAIEHTREFTWEEDGETITNVNVLDSPIIANISLQNRGNNTLYPYWDIWLPLDKMYPGGVTGFHVSIWADTGELSFITPIGYLGKPDAASLDSQTTQQGSNYGFVVGIMLIAATAAIASYLFYKRKR